MDTRDGDGTHQDRTGGDRQGQPGKPNVRARFVAKEYKTYARSELYAATPALEALMVVPWEVATGKRGGKVVARVDVRRAYFHAPARRRVFVELPKITRQVANTCAICCKYSLYGTRDAAQNLEEASTLSDLNLTRGSACPCVWKGCIRRAWDPERGKGRGDIVWTESKSGCLRNDVLGQLQRIGQSEAR